MIKAIIFDMYDTIVSFGSAPPYFGKQIAADAGIPETVFLEKWHTTKFDRSIGRMTLEKTLELILHENNCYSDELLDNLRKKRYEANLVCFSLIKEGVKELFDELKKRHIKIGLISNCFSEEVEMIRQCSIFDSFDAVCLSYEEGIIKPDPKIYQRCAVKLGVSPEECIYIGDGSGHELEGARDVGMIALQATWYLDSDPEWTDRWNPNFKHVDVPCDILDFLSEVC